MPRFNNRKRQGLLPIATIVLTLALVAPARSSAQDGKALFRYNPAELSDAQFRLLVEAISETTDPATWPRVSVRDGDGMLSIIDRAYDFYLGSKTGAARDSRGAMRLTTLRLMEIIKDKNHLKSFDLKIDTELAIPPVVPRPQLDFGFAFDNYPLTHVAGFKSDDQLGTAVYTTSPKSTASKGQLTYHAYNDDANQWSTKSFGSLGLRQPGTIAIELPQARAESLASAGTGSIVPRDRVQLELLQGPECLDAFPASPYEELAKQTLTAAVNKLEERARNAPLIIIDYDFANGHGKQVRRVADELLRRFGVFDQLKPHILEFDLNPRAHLNATFLAHPLRKAMHDYKSYLETVKATTEDARVNASDWLNNSDDGEGPGGLVIPLPPYLLQAALQTSIDKNGWLNLSWRGDRTDWVMPIEFAALITKHDTFGVVAAGNEQADILDRSPQDAASKYSQFVNVTYGTAAGATCGSRTGQQGSRVHLIAQGTSVTSANKTVGGSSFASPVVATAAWLKHLLDQTPGARMREQLIAASSYIPANDTRTVDSKGVFDPAKLLVGLGPHYVEANGSRIAFKTMELDAGKCGQFRSAAGAATQDLVVFEQKGVYQLAVRSTSESFPHFKERELCSPTTLSFMATFEIGAPKSITGVADFVKQIRAVRF